MQRLTFAEVKAAASTRQCYLHVLNHYAPGGKVLGREWSGLNPRRADRTAGSFKVNLDTGRWMDFATGDRGGDTIDLVAFLAGVSPGEALHIVAKMVGVSAYE